MLLTYYKPANDLLFPEFSCKHAKINTAYDQGCPLIDQLLDNAPYVGGCRHITVDVKVQHLDLNETTCIAGWHVDTPQDDDAIHHLFIIGENRTEFNCLDGVVRIPHDHWASFDNKMEHRGPEVLVPETRLLVRVTESNTIRGTTKILSSYPHRFPTK